MCATRSIQNFVQDAKRDIGAQLIGFEHLIDHVFTTFFAGGHLLLEDYPGTGKTAAAMHFARHMGLTFRRIQCTPDLLPADIVGTLIWDRRISDFTFRPGPIFAQIILVDEINRALPRTQSALLQAMAERHVTVDGETYPLPKPFMVMATQNHIESQGVFILPEAQLDRFTMKCPIGYPTAEQSVKILELQDAPLSSHKTADWDSIQLDDLFAQVDRVFIDIALRRYIVDIAHKTRIHPQIEVGLSTRAILTLQRTVRAYAAISGRSFVIPDDIQKMLPFVCAHRMVYRTYQTVENQEAIISSILDEVPAPVDGYVKP